MTHPRTIRWGAWILGCVLAPEDLEAVAGDLVEEYLLRCKSAPASRACIWYVGQISRSVLPLVWASVRRGGLLATVAAAVGALMLQAVVELTAKSAVSAVASDAQIAAFATAILTVPMLVLVAYLAARIRPGAAAVMAALILVAVVVQLVVKDPMPLWKQLAAVLVGPSAALAGGAVLLKRQHRSGISGLR